MQALPSAANREEIQPNQIQQTWLYCVEQFQIITDMVFVFSLRQQTKKQAMLYSVNVTSPFHRHL